MVMSIKVEGLDKIEEGLEVASERVEDFEPFWIAWSELWYDSREEMFNTQGNSTGTPWPFYSRGTNEHQYAAIKSKILNKRLTPNDLLRWTPEQSPLFESMTGPDSEFSIKNFDNRTLSLGTALEHAKNIDEGTGNMPEWAGGYPTVQRRLFEFGQRLEQDTEDLLDDFAQLILDCIEEKYSKQELTNELMDFVNT